MSLIMVRTSLGLIPLRELLELPEIEKALKVREKEIERKYCKFVGLETVGGVNWCETHGKFEKLTPDK